MGIHFKAVDGYIVTRLLRPRNLCMSTSSRDESPRPSVKTGQSIGTVTQDTTDKEDVEKLPVPSAVSDPPADVFIEGGQNHDGIKAVIGGWCVCFVTWGFVNTWTVFQSHYKIYELANESPSNISWIGTLQLGIVMVVSSPVGRLYDAGYLKWLLLASCLLTSFSFMMASLATEYYQFLLAQGFGVAFGLGFGFTPALSAIASYYRRRRAMVNGIFSSGAAIGGLVLPIALSKIINSPSGGIPWALRACGFIGFLMLGIAFLVTKQRRLPPSPKRPMLDFVHFKALNYTTLMIAGCFTLFGLYYPIFYLQPFALQKGVSSGTVFYSTAILNGASLIGRILPLIIADHIGSLNVLAMAILTAGILIFCFIAITNFAGIVAFCVFFGIVNGTYVAIYPVAIASLSDDPATIGTRIGLAYFVIGCIFLAGPPVQGVIVSATGEYWQAAVLAGSFVMCGFAATVTSIWLTRRKKGTWKV